MSQMNADAGVARHTSVGCACGIANGARGSWPAALGAAALGLLALRRRR
jgi:MYXO-CTERM domain-containing protein